MRHITGLTPQDVSCLVGNTGAVPRDCVPAGTEGEPAVEDTAVIRVRFHNGIEGRLDLTWAANRRETVYQVRGSRQTVTMIDDEITVTGESGFSELVASDFNDVSHSAWFVHLLREFAAAAGTNSAQVRRVVAERALQEALDVSAAYESARHGGLWTTVPRAADYLSSEGSSGWSFSTERDQPLVASARSAR